ncbi:hypothetical protein TELCIR_06050 [Teladorsagia circumcincta]|uniref:Uncharacterized protein n=1 Tax=Teladorsagia circumcincta TaxID=45464 RepID=A0A2G9UP36_TELCI|nr:hypothetical protein TELCIR_06050 [Teladorsagia circumcincta]
MSTRCKTAKLPNAQLHQQQYDCGLVVKNALLLLVSERRRQNNPYVFPAVGPYPHVVVLPAEPEMGNTNPDDPPPYSAIIRNDGDSGETAKEETLPPRYSDLELSSSTSSSSSGTPERVGSSSHRAVSKLTRTITIRKR